MWMVRKETNMNYDVGDDLWDDPDASVLDRETGQGRIRVVNIYNQAVGEEGWCLERLPQGLLRGQLSMLIGDFNGKGAEWDE